MDLDSVNASFDTLLLHRLPKAHQRASVVTQDYVRRGRLFGGYTIRGEGVTIGSYWFPHVVSVIHDMASTRPPGFTQVNASTSLPVHKDKNNRNFTWLIAFGDFTGGRLWIESPIGTHVPQTQGVLWSGNGGGITTTLTTPGFALIRNFYLPFF